MPRHEITLEAFVSSPSDVSEERATLEDIVRELNQTWSKSLGIRIDLVKWETHVTPAIGQNPQEVINSQVGDNYDIFIGIMWARFGTETGRAGSGTEEEFDRAHARFLKDSTSVEIMFYFKDAGIQPSEVDLDQLGRVLAFKAKLGPKGVLYGIYKSSEEFTQHLRLHLSRVVQNWKANHSVTNVSSPRSAIVVESGDKTAKLLDEPKEEVGFLDAIETSQERFEKLTQITLRMTDAINTLGYQLNVRTEQVRQATTSVSVDVKAAKRATNLLAEDMDAFVVRMEIEIPLYSEASKTAIESWAYAANLLSDFNPTAKDEIARALIIIKIMLTGLIKLQQMIISFIETLASLPRVTSAFTKARRNTIAVLEKLGNEVNASINLVSEVEKLLSDLLKTNADSSNAKQISEP
jgi:hypothetical protein